VTDARHKGPTAESQKDASLARQYQFLLAP
jgi:hypothetical protein